MTHKISYQGRAGQATPKRKLSRLARKAMAESGRKNLQTWHARATQASQRALAEIDAFRADIFRELGPNASTTRRALAENAVMAYACTVWLNKELSKTRDAQRMTVVEKASWTSGNLTRLLKQLNLDSRPRPRCLADLVIQPKAENGQNSMLKPTKSEDSPNV